MGHKLDFVTVGGILLEASSRPRQPSDSFQVVPIYRAC